MLMQTGATAEENITALNKDNIEQGKKTEDLNTELIKETRWDTGERNP